MLQDYLISFVIPESISSDMVGNFLINFSDSKFKYQIVKIKSSFLDSISSYNKLLLSTYFYDFFEGYDYILIAQLDVWIFRNNLNFWLDQQYSFVGAPIVDVVNSTQHDLKFIVGNGGLSLRRVSHMQKILHSAINSSVPVLNRKEILFYAAKYLHGIMRMDNLSKKILSLLRLALSTALKIVFYPF